MELDKERIAREIIQEDIGNNVVFSIDGGISAMPKFNAKHIMAAMFKFHDKMCESKKASTSDEALPIADVVVTKGTLCDLDGKTVRVKFKVTKPIPKIIIDDI